MVSLKPGASASALVTSRLDDSMWECAVLLTAAPLGSLHSMPEHPSPRCDKPSMMGETIHADNFCPGVWGLENDPSCGLQFPSLNFQIQWQRLYSQRRMVHSSHRVWFGVLGAYHLTAWRLMLMLWKHFHKICESRGEEQGELRGGKQGARLIKPEQIHVVRAGTELVRNGKHMQHKPQQTNAGGGMNPRARIARQRWNKPGRAEEERWVRERERESV